MSKRKRARYTGSTPIRVTWPPGEAYDLEFDEIVEPNHQLSADAPAKLRDELLSRDDWAEVQAQDSTAKPSNQTTTKEG